MKKKIAIFLLILSLLALSLIFRFSANNDEIKKIQIIANKEDFEKVYKEIYINKNEEVIKSYNAIQKRANEIVEEPLCKYEIDEGNRMLDVSRKCKEEIEVLGFTVKMMELDNTKEDASKYVKRAVEELINVSKFQDWHPEHFLDTSEMTYSVSLGYNWFYNYLTQDEKETIENAIIKNALIPGISMKYTGSFVNQNYNWNPICNGSLGISAIALLNTDKEIELKENNIDYDFQKNHLKISKEEISENTYKVTLNRLCNAIIDRTVDKLPLVYKEMQDGGYDEGTLYWEYGNSYLINFIATYDLNFDNTFDLIQDEIFKKEILYPVYMTGKSSNDLPKSKLANFGDADEYIVNTSSSTWLANKYYEDKELSQVINWYQENYFETQNIYQLLWQNYDYSLSKATIDEKEIILNNINDKKYTGTEIAILQKSVLDKDGFYIAAKAGKNANTNHSDLDAGSFILDAKGTRWIEDLGREYYNASKYWDKSNTRWTYYKKRTESHSTLNLNGENQKINTDCKITDFISNNDSSSVTMDISDAYNLNNNDTNNVIRKITLDKKNEKVTIEDQINLQKDSNIYSMFNVSGDTAITLEKENKTAILKKNVLQYDGTYKEEFLKLEIVDSNYSWLITAKKPMNSELTDLNQNDDYKYNLEKENENKLCIKIESGKNEHIKIEIY